MIPVGTTSAAALTRQAPAASASTPSADNRQTGSQPQPPAAPLSDMSSRQFEPYTTQQAPQYAPYQPPPGAYAIPVNQPYPIWVETGPTGPEIPDDKLITPSLDIKIRHGFIRKVYGLLSVMLMITFGLALMFNLWKDARDWILINPWLILGLMIGTFIGIIVLTCIPRVARSYPINMVILGLIAVAFGFILGFSSARASNFAFALAAGITAAVTIALTLFAIQTKWDFTGWGVFVLVSVVVLAVMGIVMIFVRSKILHIVYASIGALLFSFYMVYDTQQIVGGKHRKFQYSIDDYVFAALTLFMDVINLFMYILSIIQNSSDW